MKKHSSKEIVEEEKRIIRDEITEGIPKKRSEGKEKKRRIEAEEEEKKGKRKQRGKENA